VKKTILIAPFAGPLAAAIAKEARSAGYAVAIALPQAGTAQGAIAAGQKAGAPESGQPETEGASDLASLAWNPASYISASALLLSARNALGGEIDAAVILSEAGSFRADLVGGKPGEVETVLDRVTVGPALLAREILRGFEARRQGTLVLVSPDPAEPQRAPIDALAAGAFRGLGDGIFALSESAAYEAFGVLDRSETVPETARFVIRLIDAKKNGKSGRWLRFTGKPGLFGIF
jgi:hypothetical protein